MSLKKIMKNWRILVLLFAIVIAVYSINPYWIIQPGLSLDGAAIRSIEKNSSAELAGLRNPNPNDQPLFRDIIVAVNGKKISSVAEYHDAVSELQPNEVVSLSVLTNYAGKTRTFRKQLKEFQLKAIPDYEIIRLNETEEKVIKKRIRANETINGTIVEVNKTINKTIIVHKTKKVLRGVKDLGIKVYDSPKTNIKKGLDLQGGTRVLLQPERKNVSSADIDLIIDNLKERINVYGLRDVIIRKVTTPLTDDVYIMVEVAGANEEEVKELISKQGKFEAKIRNKTVFKGGKDIVFVCRSADCAFAVHPQRPCSMVAQGKYQCSFEFSITLSEEAANRQAEITNELSVDSQNPGYLNESLDLYLDDELVDSLKIGTSLKGSATRQIAISGPGFGPTIQDAAKDSAKNMRKLQTILITGSLPVKLKIVKIDSISPLLGKEFIRNAFLVGLVSILAVTSVVVIRYKKLKIAVPMVITMASEVLLLLGTAAFSRGWYLDLAAIAGIIIAVGTGVDDQIVITDETTSRKEKVALNWKDRIKKAFFIIMAAYFTTVVAMLPLLWAGAGLVKGFAISTIIGVTIGVFITRPAFAVIAEALLKKEDEA